MIDKHPDTSYNHSHEKSVKSCEKHLTRNKESGKIHSFTASQLHSFTASQLHSFTASQLHSLAAEGKLCPNKITLKHIRFFSTHNMP
ncbi:hypothetical protein [Treponema denticola]|uniref:hypothetical protein n=1 Tax=Treponema denticola TaxID=158 RepID=UPI0002B5C459|nr:hypothetical protein [Treponema denticola]EMB44051.1 hypothetical protein HMPREF9730_01991 [Treponema denticola AL-2]